MQGLDWDLCFGLGRGWVRRVGGLCCPDDPGGKTRLFVKREWIERGKWARKDWWGWEKVANEWARPLGKEYRGITKWEKTTRDRKEKESHCQRRQVQRGGLGKKVLKSEVSKWLKLGEWSDGGQVKGWRGTREKPTCLEKMGQLRSKWMWYLREFALFNWRKWLKIRWHHVSNGLIITDPIPVCVCVCVCVCV